MPDSAKIIVAVNADRPMVFSEFEDKVDAILMGFGINNDIFLDIATGKVECPLPLGCVSRWKPSRGR